jgi:hypothetical protein
MISRLRGSQLIRFPPGQIAAAFRRAWAVISLALGLTLLASALPASIVFRAAPVCRYKLRHGKSCALCGMTHAFVSISRGRFGDAARANPAGLPLYAGMAGNEMLAALAFMRRRRPGRSFSSPAPASSDSGKPQIPENLRADP